MRDRHEPTSFVKRFTGAVAVAAVLGLLLYASLAADRVVFQSFAIERTLDRDWGRLLRVGGYLPTWLLAGAGLWLLDGERRRALSWGALRRGAWVALVPTASGILGEAVKLVVRRERPNAHDGEHAFRAWGTDTFSTSGLGFPSSHACVAFGAAFALTALFPRAWPVWLALALGCCVTRLADRAHFLSDCVGSALVAMTAGTALMSVFRRVNRRAA